MIFHPGMECVSVPLKVFKLSLEEIRSQPLHLLLQERSWEDWANFPVGWLAQRYTGAGPLQ